jgi:hypothetical protein
MLPGGRALAHGIQGVIALVKARDRDADPPGLF